MNNIEELKKDYLEAKKNLSEHNLETSIKSQKKIELDSKISKLTPRLMEVKRLINEAIKGVGIHITEDEFLSLKKEQQEKEPLLKELNELKMIRHREFNAATRSAKPKRNKVFGSKQVLTDALAIKAAKDVAMVSEGSLKELISIIITNKHDAIHPNAYNSYDDVYKDIGIKLCNHLFAVEGKDLIVMPTMSKATECCNYLIENQA